MRFFVCLLCMLSVWGYAEDVGSYRVFDKEDEQLYDDLFLCDDDLDQKYIQGLNTGVEGSLYSNYYQMAQTIRTKVFVLRVASEKTFGDPFVVRLFDEVLRGGFDTLASSNNLQVWHVRVAAAYLIGERGKNLGEELKQRLVATLLKVLMEDSNERCQAAYALALARLFEGKEQSSAKELSGFNAMDKNRVVETLNQKLMHIHPDHQFLCWALVRALGILKHKSSFFVLVDTRHKGFNQKVMFEVSRALKAITSV